MRSDPLVRLTMEAMSRPPGGVVIIVGELDLDNVGAFAAVFEQMCDGAGGDIVVDLSGVDFIGFAGVATLRDAHHRLTSAGHRLSIGPVSPTVRRAFAFTGDPCDGLDEPGTRVPTGKLSLQRGLPEGS